MIFSPQALNLSRMKASLELGIQKSLPIGFLGCRKRYRERLILEFLEPFIASGFFTAHKDVYSPSLKLFPRAPKVG